MTTATVTQVVAEVLYEYTSRVETVTQVIGEVAYEYPVHNFYVSQVVAEVAYVAKTYTTRVFGPAAQ